MTSSADLVPTINDHIACFGLAEFLVRRSLGGWQAIAKYEGFIGGPWGVGCHEIAAEAMRLALAAGEREWRRHAAPKTADFDDILG